MARAIYTSKAKADIRQIANYISQDSLLAALAWTDRIRAVCDLLAIQPGIGEKMQSRRYGDARRYVSGSYLIYYRPTAIGVDIFRIVHGARDQQSLL